MAKKRRYHRLVADDLSAAIAQYEAVSLELGNRFRASLRQSLQTISDRPGSFACIHKEVRASMVEEFPYVVLFEDRREIVAILGIYHAASDQAGWFERSV